MASSLENLIVQGDSSLYCIVCYSDKRITCLWKLGNDWEARITCRLRTNKTRWPRKNDSDAHALFDFLWNVGAYNTLRLVFWARFQARKRPCVLYVAAHYGRETNIITIWKSQSTFCSPWLLKTMYISIVNLLPRRGKSRFISKKYTNQWKFKIAIRKSPISLFAD